MRHVWTIQSLVRKSLRSHHPVRPPFLTLKVTPLNQNQPEYVRHRGVLVQNVESGRNLVAIGLYHTDPKLCYEKEGYHMNMAK